jgi:hypothetical protein
MIDAVTRRDGPVDGDTERCPECGDRLVFLSRYPLLSVGPGVPSPQQRDGVHYHRVWLCRNGDCHYRELL